MNDIVKPSILDRLNEVMEPKNQVPVVVKDTKVEDDYEFVRAKLKNIVEVGENAIEELAQICGELENPVEAYSSLSKLIKDTSDATGKIMTVAVDKASIANSKPKEAPPPISGGTFIQNNFTGTTQEVLDRMTQEEAIENVPPTENT